MLHDIAKFFHTLVPSNAAIIDINTSNEYKAMTDSEVIDSITQSAITSRTDNICAEFSAFTNNISHVVHATIFLSN